MRPINFVSVIGSFVFALSACGGGGSSDPAPVASVTEFALQAGYEARIASGALDNFSISGTCSGTATITTSSASAASFEGVSGNSATTTLTLNLTSCTPASNAVTGTSYFDEDYTPLGSSIPGVEYTAFETLPPSLPASVKVGDTAVFATQTVYSDSTKSTATGQRELSYVVQADSSTTATVVFITKSYDTSSQLLWTQQSKFRIAGDGTLTMVSIDVQFSTTSTSHFLYTKT